MTALDKDRSTPALAIFAVIAAFEFDAAAGGEYFTGGIGCLDGSGNVVVGSTSTGLTCLGRIVRPVDNTAGGAGDVKVKVEPGIFRYTNGSDSITAADKGEVCYIVDDQTVHITDGSATRSKAGVVVDVDDDGVWVAMGFDMFSNPAATPAGTLQKKSVTLTHGAVTATPNTDGTVFTANVGTALPAGAVVVGAKLTNTTDWSGGGLASMTVQVGVASADLDSIIAASDVFTGAATGIRTGVEGDEIGKMQGAVQLVATLTPDGSSKTSDPTAGVTTVDVYYFVAF